MALAHCIFGNSLGVVSHCFPPPLDLPTFDAKCQYVRNDARDRSSERWNCGGEIVRNFCLNSDFHLNLGIFYVPQIYDMGTTALIPLRRKACWGFFHPKTPTVSVEFEPTILGTKGQHATHRPPKSPCTYYWNRISFRSVIIVLLFWCCPTFSLRYVGQTVRPFKIGFRIHLHDFQYGNGKSRFAQHPVDNGHSIGRMEDFMYNIHISSKVKIIVNLEKYYVFRETKLNNKN